MKQLHKKQVFLNFHTNCHQKTKEKTPLRMNLAGEAGRFVRLAETTLPQTTSFSPNKQKIDKQKRFQNSL